MRAAFTLIELILVMTIMIVMISIVFPSLKGFFRGRNLDNEARRFLSLTRYGQAAPSPRASRSSCGSTRKPGSYRIAGARGLHGNADQLRGLCDGPRRVQIAFSAPSSV